MEAWSAACGFAPEVVDGAETATRVESLLVPAGSTELRLGEGAIGVILDGVRLEFGGGTVIGFAPAAVERWCHIEMAEACREARCGTGG